MPLAFRVSAVAVFDTEIVPAAATADDGPLALLSPPFAATRVARSIIYEPQVGVRLRPGASMTAFLNTATVLALRYPPPGYFTVGPAGVTTLSNQVAVTQRAIRPDAIVLAAFAVVAGLIALVSTPHRYGQNWDQIMDLGEQGASGAFGAKVLSAEPAIAGYSAGNYGQLTIDGRAVAAVGIGPRRGAGLFTLLAGHPPSGPAEIVMGAQTLRTLHRRLGQTVQVVVQALNGSTGTTNSQLTMRIVGVAVFPLFALVGMPSTDLGTGAAVSAPLLSAQSSLSPGFGCNEHVTCHNFFLIRYKPGTDLNAAATRLTRAVTAAGCVPLTCGVYGDQRPGDIVSYAAVRDTPLVLAAGLALLAAAMLAHMLITGVRRRRRDLAVLKTLGLTRSQLLKVVSWQASALTAVALLAGLPLGMLAGRLSWELFAGTTGVTGQAMIPVPLVLLAVPATLLLANLAATGPGWTAAHTSAALILSSE